VRSTDLVSPVASSNRDERELGQDDRAADGRSDFLGAFNSEADMSVSVAYDDEGLEASPLPCAGLFLDGHDLHDFVLELGSGQKSVDDLVFLDGNGEKVDVLESLDLVFLDEATQLGDGDPGSCLAVSSPSSASSPTSSSASAFTTTTCSAETSSSSS